MILRKTPSQFLRTLRQISPDHLPALPEKRLSRRQQRRLEDAVFARIAKAENRTVFDRYAARTHADGTADFDTAQYEMRYEIKPIRGAWKKNLAAVLAACLCFAVICSAFLLRGNIASYLTSGRWSTDGAVTDHEDTQAINRDTSNALYWESDLPETGVAPPYESAEGFALEVTKAETYIGHLSLAVKLTLDEPIEGITVQYSRLMLHKWNPDTKEYDVLYDAKTTHQPKLEVLAGEVHFPIIGMGQTKTAQGEIMLSRDLRGESGIIFLTLEGLTLVRDSDDPNATDYEQALIAEVLTDKTVSSSFVIYHESVPEQQEDHEPLPPRDTVTGPPESAFAPPYPSADYALTLKNESVSDNVTTLGLRLETPLPLPEDAHAVYYSTCEIDLWNHEKQVWENKYGVNLSDASFETMLMAGDIHFLVDREDGTVNASLPFTLPDDGWYRMTLHGLILVREAREDENAEWNLVREQLEDHAVYTVFHKE